MVWIALISGVRRVKIGDGRYADAAISRAWQPLWGWTRFSAFLPVTRNMLWQSLGNSDIISMLTLGAVRSGGLCGMSGKPFGSRTCWSRMWQSGSIQGESLRAASGDNGLGMSATPCQDSCFVLLYGPRALVTRLGTRITNQSFEGDRYGAV